MATAYRRIPPSITDDQHGAGYRAGRVPAEQIVSLFVPGIAGPGDDLVALHLALSGGALLALAPVITEPRAVDLNTADTSLSMGLSAGG